MSRAPAQQILTLKKPLFHFSFSRLSKSLWGQQSGGISCRLSVGLIHWFTNLFPPNTAGSRRDNRTASGETGANVLIYDPTPCSGFQSKDPWEWLQGGTGEGERTEPRIRNSTDQLDPQKAFCFFYPGGVDRNMNVLLIFFKFDSVSEDETKFILKVETKIRGATTTRTGERKLLLLLLLLLYSVGRTDWHKDLYFYNMSSKYCQ